jgi:hypothetical protein
MNLTIRQILNGALEVLVNIALPYLVFTLARTRLGDVQAMMIAAAPPILWSLLAFARRRRADALSLLVLTGIALSLIAFLGGGGVRFLQMREQLVIAVIGLVFLISAAINRPLIYQLSRARLNRASPDNLAIFESLRDNLLFRRAMMAMTLVWGVCLVGEAATACMLVFTLPIPQYLIVSPIMGYSTLGLTTAWTFWYARRRVIAARRQLGLTPAARPARRGAPQGSS